jgi:hypothetical protein
MKTAFGAVKATDRSKSCTQELIDGQDARLFGFDGYGRYFVGTVEQIPGSSESSLDRTGGKHRIRKHSHAATGAQVAGLRSVNGYETPV